MDYGRQILSASMWDRWPRLKNRILTRQQIPINAIRLLLDQISSCGVRLEILGGEPLLRKDIVEIVDYAKRKASVPFVSLYTNGLAATTETSAALHEAGLDAAIVTLISHRKEVHDAFTGTPGSWEGTVEGIRNLVLTVKANGDVQPCPFISDLPIGNIYRSDIWDIYRNRYQGTALREFKKPPDECASCSYESVCSGGCKAGNNIMMDGYSHRDHRCAVTSN